MSEEAGAQTVDPKEFIKRLAPDQLGMFEPLSGLMLLNASRAEMQAITKRQWARQSTESDVAMLRTIDHETYHFAQAAASGYVFHRQRGLFMALENTIEPIPDFHLDPELLKLAEEWRKRIGDDPDYKLRYERAMAILEHQKKFTWMEARAAAGDNSVMGALYPGFFAHFKALTEAERIANADGLSILGLIEGSAVAHVHLLKYPIGYAPPRMQAELAPLPAVYHELYDLTAARMGDRSVELLLPAVALALRYAQPHNAYAPLLALLAESKPGEALERGRSLAGQLPEISGAGPLLGTAIEQRRLHDGYRVYDPILEKLANLTWGFDSYDFLARPAAMESLNPFPVGIALTDGYVMGGMDRIEFAGRVTLMGLVLRSQSRRRAERESWRLTLDWARSVISGL
jgi:hypothetical protein